MRTRHILTALALPALFAACTADEFETVSQDNGLQERPKLSEDFTLMTGVAETRYAVEGGSGITFNFEQGDRIGAAIIDQYVPNEEPEDFDVIPSLAGNYPFDFQGGDEWTSNTQLGIGHYMFVFPYNPNDNNRAAVAYELPVVQEMYTNENGEQVLNAAVEKGNKAVATVVLHEGETVADISLKNLFTYPKLTINFDNGEDVTTVSQIVLKANDDDHKFLVKGGFDHAVVADMFAQNYNKNLDGKEYWSDEKGMDWDKVGTYDFLLEKGSQYEGYTTFEYSDYIIVKFPKNTKLQPAANTNNKYVEARIMMPSIEKFEDSSDPDNILSGDYTLYVYTDNGIYATPFEPESFSFRATTSQETIEAALHRNQSNGLSLKALNGSNRTNDVDNIVTTLEDWNNLVDTYGDHSVSQDIAIVGEDFAFDETAKWPTECVFTINTDVNVDGEVEIENVKVNGTINVKKGATLTVNNTLIAEKIVNEGTVEMVAESDKDNQKAAYIGINTIENKAILNIAKDADVEFTLTNGKYDMKAINAAAVVTNNGELQIFGENYGTINNNGVLSTVGFVNQSAKYDANNVLEYMPIINNAKNARILSEAKTLSNNGTLVNEGTLTCQNRGGEIENVNGGILDSKTGAITYITENTGKIVVYSANTSNVTVNSQSGIVEYETENATESFDGSLVTDVIASDDLTLSATDKNVGLTVTFQGDATLTLTKDKATIAGLVVEEGTVTLGSDVTVSALNVAEGAEIIVPDKTKLTYTADANSYTNEGRILVGGEFYATNVDRANGGLVENNGGNSKIEWAPTAADEAEADYNAAVTEITQAWMLWTGIDTWAKVDALSGDWDAEVVTTLASGKTWNALFTEAMTAYNTWQDALGKVKVDADDFEPIMEKAMADVISGYKTNSEADVKAAFNAKYPDNTWITEAVNGDMDYGVFRKLTKDAKLADIKTEKGSVMVEYFATNAVNIQLSEVKVSTDDDADVKRVENKAVWLTLQSLDDEVEGVKNANVKDAYIPDYSYVCLYEGAGEYDIMKDVKELYTRLTSDGGATWLTGQGIANVNSLETLDGVKKFVSAVKDAKEGKITEATSYEKQLIADSGLADKFNTVWAWKYTNKQIAYLYDNVK